MDINKNIVILFIFCSLVLGNGAYPTVASKILLVLVSLPLLTSSNITKTIKPYLLWCVAFAAFCWASIYWADDKTVARYFITTVSFVYICNVSLASLLIQQNRPSSYWLKVFMYCALLMSLWFIATHGLTYGSEDSRGDTAINMNTIGMVAAISGSLALYFYKWDNESYKDKRYIILFLAFMLIVLLSASRKALMIPLIVYGIFKIYSGKHSRLFLNVIVIGAVSIIALWAVLHVPILYDMIGYRMEGMVNAVIGNEDEIDGSTNTRMMLIEFGLLAFSEKPWLGHGVANFRAVYTNYFPGRNELYAHNNYIELLVDVGIIGIAIYYIIYLYLLFKLIRIVKDTHDSTAIILLAILVSMIFVHYGFVAYYSLFNNILLTITATYVISNSKKTI